MKRYVWVIAVCVLSGCLAAGDIREVRSEQDGVTVTEMNQIGVAQSKDGKSSRIQIGLVHSSLMKPSEMYLKAYVDRRGVEGNDILDKDSLTINVDGQLIVLSPIDIVRRSDKAVDSNVSPDGLPRSHRIYSITQQMLEQMIKGKKVSIQISLAKELLDEELPDAVEGSARLALQKYYEYLYADPSVKRKQKVKEIFSEELTPNRSNY